ncbi:MAG TPA: hypothetical protein VFD39_08525 [Trueperaceae bacterium]|nr:hypothetical protein [Trueperaceae bacterium]
MSPLVALLLFGFMFVIALSLTIWAALTLGDQTRRAEAESQSVAYVPLGSSRPVWRSEENEVRKAGGIERRSQPSGERADGRRSTDPAERRTGLPPVPQPVPAASPVNKDENHSAGGPADGRAGDGAGGPAGDGAGGPADGGASGIAGASAGGGRSNDEFRGARATVTQRPNNDDAFERFLENDRD